MTIGVDLGGTSIRCGLVDCDRVVTKLSEPCLSDRPENEVLDQLERLISKLINPQVKGIGIGVPSVVDMQKGIVYNVVNIPSWIEVHLKDIFEAKFNLPVFVNNDSNCFALGEHAGGMGKPFRNMLGVTLGTGVGAGVIVDNELYSGSNTGAGEIGCMPYLGHNYEYYCGSNFFTAFYGMTGKEAAQRAAAGDVQALKIWEEFGFHIGILIQTILYAYDPDAIVFGGSIANAYPFFSAKMKESMAAGFDYPETIKKIRILISNQEDISLLGAASLVKTN